MSSTPKNKCLAVLDDAPKQLSPRQESSIFKVILKLSCHGRLTGWNLLEFHPETCEENDSTDDNNPSEVYSRVYKIVLHLARRCKQRQSIHSLSRSHRRSFLFRKVFLRRSPHFLILPNPETSLTRLETSRASFHFCLPLRLDHPSTLSICIPTRC